MMQRARTLVEALAFIRTWWILLVPPLLLGSIYGFYWYWPQLQATPVKYWLVVPDSPGSSLLLCIWLIALIAGADWRRPGMQILGAVAFVSNMKYGLWTPIINVYTGIFYGWTFDLIHLSISHGAMWVLGLLYARYYPPRLAPAVIALLWIWFQDLVDYVVLGTHPTLWYEDQVLLAGAAAVALSTIWGLFLVVQAMFDRSKVAG